MDYINEKLQSLAVPIDKLFPDQRNARTHDARNIDTIANSLRQFKQQKPIVVKREGDGTLTVIAGNGTLDAARKLGWTHVAAVEFDNSEPGLALAFGLADNKSAELAEWDFEALSGIIRDLPDYGIDPETLGWTDYEIEPLLQADWTPPSISDDSSGGSDKHSVLFSAEQWEVIGAAVEKLRNVADDQSIGDGRALELVCADYLAGS